MKVFLYDIWKSFIKKIPLFLVVILFSAFIGVALLTFLFILIPTVPNEYITESATCFQDVGSRQEIFSWCTSELDNWTDALILQISADNTNDTALNRALLAYYGANYANDGNPVDSIKDYYLNHRPYDLTDIYPRYWHGYLLLIRPLICLMSYSKIRLLNGFFQLSLNVLILFLLKKKNLYSCIIPYILSILMLMPLAQAMSLQFSSCFYIFSFGVIALLLCRNQKYFSLVFLFIGIATAFFDFLTYPIATFGIPAVIALSLERKRPFSNILILLCSWLLGYGGMWASKWIFTELITNQDIISNVKLAILSRTSSSVASSSLTAAIVLKENISAFFHTPFTFVSILFLIILFILFAMQRKKIVFTATSLPYVFISLLPLVWFSLTQNHSYIHSFYTNKSCVVLFFSFLSAINRSFLPFRDSTSISYQTKK